MAVEKRYSFRNPVDIPVHIRYRKRRFFCARATNLSAEGMYLEVQSLTLPTGTLVELELQHRGEDLLLPAVVVYRTDGGIGVGFREAQVDLYTELSRTRPPAVSVPASVQPSYS